MEQVIHHYAAYDLWATTRFVERLQRESDEVLDRPVTSSFPSLRRTLLHIRDADNTWWGRLTGTRTTWPAEESLAIDGLLTYATRFHDLVLSYDDEQLKAMVSYQDLKGNTYTQPAWQLILHCLNHAMQHRGQVITQMRALGLEDIPANDLVVFQRTL